MACHKKCYNRVTGECKLNEEIVSGRRVFGVPVHKLASDGKVPVVVDRLITTIEMYGLYTEGIYRKSGVSSNPSGKNFFVIKKKNLIFNSRLLF
mgnify:CR=1 FL=1